jgi:hypothetical protein
MRNIYERICCCLIAISLVPRAEGSVVPLPILVLAWINNHLDHCTSCRIELKKLRFTTFALRRAASSSPKKAFDPRFAERVLNRVRKGEARHKRKESRLRVAYAGASTLAVAIVGLGILGGFNNLKAQWFDHKPVVRVARPAASPVTPYAIHDPFALVAGGTRLSFDQSKSLASRSIARQRIAETHLPVPDMLSGLWLQHHQAVPIDSPMTTTQFAGYLPRSYVAAPAPALAPSSYLQQDNRAPLDLCSNNGTAGLNVVIPEPSEPNTANVMRSGIASATDCLQQTDQTNVSASAATVGSISVAPLQAPTGDQGGVGTK